MRVSSEKLSELPAAFALFGQRPGAAARAAVLAKPISAARRLNRAPRMPS
jgi:hypothetical protein